MTDVIVLGVVFLVLVVLLAVAVTIGNPGQLELDVFNASVPVTLTGVFFTGAGAVVVLLLGIVLIQRGVAREGRRRRQLKPLPLPAASAPHPRRGSSPADPPAPALTPVDAPAPALTPVDAPTAAQTPTPGEVPTPQGAQPDEDRAAKLVEADELTGDDQLR